MISIPSTQFYSIPEAASELGVDPIAVRRLIAKGHVVAVCKGTRGYHLADTELAAYINRGCPDLAMPAHDEAWFDDSPTAAAFCEVREQLVRPIIESLRGVKVKAGRETVIPLCQEAREILQQAPRDEEASDFATLAMAYAVMRLRALAWDGLHHPNGNPKTKDWLLMLYASPAHYAATLAKALRGIGQSHLRILVPVDEARDAGAKVNDADADTDQAVLLIPDAEICEPKTLAAAKRLAF